MKKIFLSPSNQTGNKYASGNTNESVQCGLIAQSAEKALVRCGFHTKLMHRYEMGDKVKTANEWGADLYIPIHTNAYNGKVSGTRIFCYSENKTSNGYKACKAMLDVLSPFTLGTSDSWQARPGLYEVAKPSAPTVYIEVDFHDVPKVAEWIIANTSAIGEKICEGVCKYFNVPYVEPEKEASTGNALELLKKALNDICNLESVKELEKLLEG